MQELNVWKICDKLSVVQSVLLILGLNPSDYETIVGDKPNQQHPAGYDAIFQALKEAITTGTLNATVISKDLASILVIGMIPDEKHIIENSETDWHTTTIQVTELKAWLLSKDIAPDFFFSPADDLDPLNKDGKYYAPKLAAAISAWKNVSNNTTFVQECGNPKQAIETWLAEHGEEYGLIKDGKITNQGFDQISTIANWEPAGGRAKKSAKK